jgi:hypothetical protein
MGEVGGRQTNVINLLEVDGTYLKYVKTKTAELCEIAVNQTVYAIEFVPPHFQTESMCMTAVKQDGLLIQYVDEQTYDLCKEAVQNDGLSIQFIDYEYLTDELCRLAIENTPLAFHLIPEEKNTDTLFTLILQDKLK